MGSSHRSALLISRHGRQQDDFLGAVRAACHAGSEDDEPRKPWSVPEGLLTALIYAVSIVAASFVMSRGLEAHGKALGEGIHQGLKEHKPFVPPDGWYAQ